MFAYLMVLQILGIMLAFQTRRVKIKSLKDSTFVAANVYISSIVIVMFILVTFALRSYLNAYSAIFAIGIFILTTTFLMLTFVPKVLPSYSIVTLNLYNEAIVQRKNSYLAIIVQTTLSTLELNLIPHSFNVSYSACDEDQK